MPMLRGWEVRVNTTDYKSGIEIEARYRTLPDGSLGWGVPAWESYGLTDFADGFLTFETAQRALEDAVDSEAEEDDGRDDTPELWENHYYYGYDRDSDF